MNNFLRFSFFSYAVFIVTVIIIIIVTIIIVIIFVMVVIPLVIPIIVVVVIVLIIIIIITEDIGVECASTDVRNLRTNMKAHPGEQLQKFNQPNNAPFQRSNLIMLGKNYLHHDISPPSTSPPGGNVTGVNPHHLFRIIPTTTF